MNWAECTRQQEWLGLRDRFQWPEEGLSGFNCEAGTTVSDVTGSIAWVWTYPGDWLLRLPEVNRFLELDPLHTGGWISGLAPLGVYFVLVVLAELLKGQ